MKRKTLIVILVVFIAALLSIFVGFTILAYGYGGGRGVRPVEPTKDIIKLEEEIRKEVKSDVADIDNPRNYEIDNCNKYGFLQQKVSIHINNDSLKNEIILKKYIISVNERVQKIFPHDKKCYDSVVIRTQYFDTKLDSVINKKFSFPMIK